MNRSLAKLRLTALLLLAVLAAATAGCSRTADRWVSYVGPSVEGSYLLSLVRADGTGKSLIFEELASHGPVLIWAPDGERAVVANRTDGNSYLASPGDGSYGICLTCGLDAPGTPAPSPDGRRAAVAASDGIYLVALDGSGPSRVASFSRPGRPSWSPDGQALAFDARGDGGPRGIYLLDLRTGETRSLTAALVGEAFAPSWSPDADHIAFHSLDREGLHLMTVTPDEAALALVTDWDLDVEILDPGLLMSPAWSPDGEWIAFAASSTLGDLDIFIVRPDGADLTNITNYPGIDDDPTWSPDGELIAFRTDRDGNWEIYVMASDGSGTVDLSQSPGTDECCPGWRP